MQTECWQLWVNFYLFDLRYLKYGIHLIKSFSTDSNKQLNKIWIKSKVFILIKNIMAVENLGIKIHCGWGKTFIEKSCIFELENYIQHRLNIEKIIDENTDLILKFQSTLGYS